MVKNIVEANIVEVLKSYAFKISNQKSIDDGVVLAGIELRNELNRITENEPNLDYLKLKLTNNQDVISVDAIKLADISRLLPNPSESDSELYSFVFKAFAELQRRHLLGLRYGLRGRTTLFGMSVGLSFSNRDFVISAMQESFGSFVNDWSSFVSTDAIDIPETELQRILESIQANILSTDPKVEEIADLLEEEKNISLLYLTHSPAHWTSVVANKDIIIFADRWSSSIQTNKGIDICQYSNQKDVVVHLKQLHEEAFQGNISTREKDARIKENYKQIINIPLSLQKADNCGWSSGAKTIIYSNAILAFYKYFSKHLADDDALLKAQACAEQLYHHWAQDYDRVQALRDALEQPDDYIDVTLIAKILLQSENKAAPYREKITEMILKRSIVNNEVKSHATHQLLEDIKTTLKEDRTQTFDQAKEYLSYYLSQGGTKKADAFIKKEDSKLKEEKSILLKLRDLCRKLELPDLVSNNVLTPNDFEVLSKAENDKLIEDVSRKALSNEGIQDALKYDSTFDLERIFNTPKSQLLDLIAILNMIGQDFDLELKLAEADIGATQILDWQITSEIFDVLIAKSNEEKDFLIDHQAVQAFVDTFHKKLDSQEVISHSSVSPSKKK